MKLFWAILFGLVLAAVLGAGLVRAVEGSPWLLLAAVVGYVLAFARIGCLEH